LEKAYLLNLSSDAILVRDANDRITYWNEGAQRAYGYTASEAFGKRPHELLRTESAEPLEHVHEILRTAGHWSGELVHTRKDGTKITVASRWSLHRDAHGNPVSILETASDITDQRRSEKRLLESEERFRSIFEYAATGIAIADWQGRFRQSNPAFSSLSGYTQEELEHLTLPELVHPDDRQAFVEAISRAKQDEQSFEIEIRCVRKDGRIVWANKRVSLLRDERGAPAQFVVLVTDITERKRSQERLRASEERFRKVFEHAGTGIVISDLGGRIRQVNPAFSELLGYASDELVGLRISDIVHPDHREANISEVLRLEQEKFPSLEIENRYVRKDGETVLAHEFISFLPNESGAPTSLLALVTDVTERRRMEQAQRDADRRKDEFLATLAHELRNPLAPLRNALNLFKRLGGEGPNGEKLRAMMERQVNHLVRLVDDLLEVSRITRGNIELRKEKLDLANVIENAVEISQPLIKAGGHKLTVSLTQEQLLVEGDPVRLTQVFANLLNNAAKYTEHAGRIELTARRQGSEVVVSVRDSGIGISAEMLPRVFDLFAQADRRVAGAREGIGVGLTLVRSLVHLHNGRVEVRSEGLGHGSEFLIRLPLTAAAARATQADMAAS
jgi:PAS domain S-box-containing protein